MTTRTVYTIDGATGAFIAPLQLGPADLSPLEPGVWLLPADTTDIAPPQPQTSIQHPYWSGTQWELRDKPADAPEIETLPDGPPTTCTPAQGYVALYALKSVTKQMLYEAVDQIPDPVQKYIAQIGLEHTSEWRRESATMRAVAQLLSLTEQDLDDLFAYAAGVEI